MKVVIIGGTGLIGRKLATKLQSAGHHVVAASPSTGVNSFTGVVEGRRAEGHSRSRCEVLRSGPRQRRPCPLGPIHCWTDTLCRLGTLPMLNPLIKRRVTVKKIALLLLAGASLLSTNVAAQEMNAPATKVSKVFDRELPNVPGKSMRAVLVEYGPGAASPSHRHPSSAFIYATVLEGEIRSKVNDEPEHVYKAGESWTEMPGDHHKVSANASSTKPARLLAIFIVDTTEQEIVIPDK
jgi:quercetin dioxygenase-like cupin family protein